MNTLKASLEIDFIETKPFTPEEQHMLSEYLLKQKTVPTHSFSAKRTPAFQKAKVFA